MSWHIVAYSATTPLNSVNADTAFVSDLGVVPTFNGHALLPGDFMLSFAVAMGATLSRARLDSGQLRVLGQPYIHPINPAVLPTANPNVAWWFRQPFKLPQREEIAAQLSNGAAEVETVILGLHKSYDPWPAGNVWIVRFTNTTATVANKWTNIGQPTMETALPVGTYSMLWSDLQSANGQAHRWVFPPTVGLRPGFLSQTSVSNRNPYDYYEGVLGTMGQYVNDVLPFIEVLCNGADASYEGRMAIVRVQSSIGSMNPMGPLGVAGP
jgi:hypothetical protein